MLFFFFVGFVARHNISNEIVSLDATEISVFADRIVEVFLIAFKQDEVFYIIFPY